MRISGHEMQTVFRRYSITEEAAKLIELGLKTDAEKDVLGFAELAIPITH